MREKNKIDEFQEDIDNGKLDITFDKLVNKAIELIKEIAKMKKLSIEDIDFKDKESLFYYLKKLFEENSASFQSIVTLMNNFLRWNIAPEDDFGTTKEEKIEMYIRNYNLIIYELDDYENVENEIKEKGYENLKNEKIEKLISIFKEMLKYKEKEYKDNWCFKEWIDKIDTYYHFYHEELHNVLEQVENNCIDRNIYIDYQVSIRTDEVENMIALNDLYNELSSETDGYKHFADFYKEINLKEGQTYADLYNAEIEKFTVLFKEMLDFLNVKYNANDFYTLKSLVMNNYPYFLDNIISLDFIMSNPTETYISLLNEMEMIYDYFSKSYRNHEENMKKYKEELEKQKIEEDLDFLDSEF